MNKSPVKKRAVTGILLLNKPKGITSNAALQKVKRLFQAKKAGHTGSLDPLAEGMLPLCFGEATKFSQYLLDADKCYRVTAQLGVQTTTGDAEGEIVAEKPVPELSLAEIERRLTPFRGQIQQVPSMYSALKHKGQPLYKLARQGIEVERKPRTIMIYQLQVHGFTSDTIDMEILCSKGTYIRTLVEDFGQALGCGAHVTKLTRLSVSPFKTDEMIDYDRLEETAREHGPVKLEEYLLPITAAVAEFPMLELTSSSIYYLRQGHPILVPNLPTTGWVAFKNKSDQFVGVGEILDDGRVAPRRLVRTAN